MMTKRICAWIIPFLQVDLILIAFFFSHNAAAVVSEVITAQEAADLLRIELKSFELLMGTQSFPCRSIGMLSQIRCNRSALLSWLKEGPSQHVDVNLASQRPKNLPLVAMSELRPLSNNEAQEVRGKGNEPTTQGSPLEDKTQGIEPALKEGRLIRSDIPVLKPARSTTVAFNYGFSSVDQTVPGLGLGSDLTRTNSAGLTVTRALTDTFSAFASAGGGRSFRRVEDTLSVVPEESNASSRSLTLGFNYELPIFKSNGAPRTILSASIQPKTSYSPTTYKSTLTLTKDYDPATLFGSVGLRYDQARQTGGFEVPSSLSMTLGAGGALAVNDQLTLSASYNLTYATDRAYYDGLQQLRYSSSISPSATLVVGKSSVVYLNLNFPLASFSANQSFGLGYQYSF